MLSRMDVKPRYFFEELEEVRSSMPRFVLLHICGLIYISPETPGTISGKKNRLKLLSLLLKMMKFDIHVDKVYFVLYLRHFRGPRRHPEPVP